MNQIEFFEAVKAKAMKEVVITLTCDCQLLYSAVTEETFVKPCPTHKNDI